MILCLSCLGCVQESLTTQHLDGFWMGQDGRAKINFNKNNFSVIDAPARCFAIDDDGRINGKGIWSMPEKRISTNDGRTDIFFEFTEINGRKVEIKGVRSPRQLLLIANGRQLAIRATLGSDPDTSQTFDYRKQSF